MSAVNGWDVGRMFGWLRPLLATVCGLAIGVLVSVFAGEDPLFVFYVIVNGAFGSAYDIGMTLFYTTPLIFCGLAVALPFHCGLFNIGGEGQLAGGALGAVLAGIFLPASVPPPLAVTLATLAAFAGGASVGAVAGWLRAWRGSHEVISTIMLNFIVAGLVSWVVLYLIHSEDSQNPESMRISPAFALEPFAMFDGAPAGWPLMLAVAVALLCHLLLQKSVFGFRLRTVGESSEAAAVAGMPVARLRFLAMLLAGGLAGLVGVAEILGNAGRLRLGFSPDFGFIGIPVALLARCHPVGVIFGALLFGALHKGTGELDLETDGITRDLSMLIQATVILTVSADAGLAWMQKRGLRTGLAFWRKTRTAP